MDVDSESDVEILNSSTAPLTVQTVKETYRNAWIHYHNWSLQSSKETLQSIQSAAATVDSAYFDLPVDDLYGHSEHEKLKMGRSLENSDPEEFVVIYPDSGYKDIFSSPVFKAKEIVPYPTYESCTPSTQNLGPQRESSIETDYMYYFPYADAPNFNFLEYSYLFDELAWQGEGIDPNAESINLETLQRLLAIPGASLKSIDALNILPRLRLSEQNGFLWRVSQRDFDYIQLDSNAISMAAYQKAFSAESDRFSINLKTFCANLNCIHSHCRTHIEHKEFEFGHIDRVEPKLRSEDFMDSKRPPHTCGTECYLNMIDENDENDYLDETTTQILWAILIVSPDVIPCHLVHACHRPCYQIFAGRKKLLPDDGIMNRIITQKQKVRNMRFVDDDEDRTAEFSPPVPCHHVGSCNENENCICWMSNIRCQRTCHCDPNCETRWTGCGCRPHSTETKGTLYMCRDQDCKCFLAGRECDPELCKDCGASAPKRRRKKRHGIVKVCRNVQIQQRLCKVVEIRPATYGLGAFLMENATEGDLISEYVGELILDDEIAYGDVKPRIYKIREFHNNFRKRNYMFDLNDRAQLDAISISNEMRFPNHDRHNYNCCFLRKYVHGEHRIGIYAEKTIHKGQEILLHYGDNFFT